MSKSQKCNTAINTWPQDDRPREKLLKNGEHTLSNSELLAILLRTGVKVMNVNYGEKINYGI